MDPIHRYAITQHLLQASREVLQVQQGSLYRLEGRGYLEAEWRETEQGRMAKFYCLTAKSLRQLAHRVRTD